jgi:hypothetical protein
MLDILASDAERCIDGIAALSGWDDPDYGFHARQVIRATFAYIEAGTFFLKGKAAEHCFLHNRQLTTGELLLAEEIDYRLTDKGTVVERQAHTRLTDNLRFMFALAEKAYGCTKKFDPSTEWWACLQSSIKVRDRLAHPKRPEDVDVSVEELKTMVKAFAGFGEQLTTYTWS